MKEKKKKEKKEEGRLRLMERKRVVNEEGSRKKGDWMEWEMEDGKKREREEEKKREGRAYVKGKRRDCVRGKGEAASIRRKGIAV
jgi:hypothetical protein